MSAASKWIYNCSRRVWGCDVSFQLPRGRDTCGALSFRFARIARRGVAQRVLQINLRTGCRYIMIESIDVPSQSDSGPGSFQIGIYGLPQTQGKYWPLDDDDVPVTKQG